MKILVLNSGSSSLKYQLIDMKNQEVLAKGYFERIGQLNSFLTHKVNGKKHKFEHLAENHEKAIEFVLERLLDSNYGVIKNLNELSGIGHRVVHGGERFTNSVIITDEVVEEIKKCIVLAPLHNPAAILGIEACEKIVPNMKMVAVFDTAFHQTISKEKYIYPIPYKYYEKYGIRKYGFHGTSHQFVAHRVAEILNKDIKELKIVNCHLGQGCSICAIEKGKSVETSMGLTPLGGIPMGARAGDLDPSILTFLMKKEKLSSEEMNNILNKKSGIYGVSGLSIDMRDIETEVELGGLRAKLSLDVFHYLVAQYIAKSIVAMEGIDVLTFTAGIGEKGPISRKAICEQLEFFGIQIDEKLNDVKGEEREISKIDSKVKVYVVPTNEELMIAKETMNLIK